MNYITLEELLLFVNVITNTVIAFVTVISFIKKKK